jgi:hypothetical protein
MASSTAWTYDNTLLSTSTANADVMAIRLMIGDRLPGRQLFYDAEILYQISQFANLYLAGAELCRNLSLQYATQVDIVQGELKTNYSQITKMFAERAAILESRGMAIGGAMPYAGGISVADKQSYVDDTDRVMPQYDLGMTDNLSDPVGPVGQQTPGNPAPGGGGPSNS